MAASGKKKAKKFWGVALQISGGEITKEARVPAPANKRQRLAK